MARREFEIGKAKRSEVPLQIGLFGPSGGGKTFSALRLATGIQRIVGGRIAVIDTEAGRATHYADDFDFDHVPFGEPFGSLDYLEVLRFVHAKGARVAIVDSMSHEHEGPGGHLEYHAREVERMSGGDARKAERIKMLAWGKPKAERRRLLNETLRMPMSVIYCFRAKNSSKPVMKDGKTEVVSLGFVPIGGDDFVFECALSCLLLPAADGVPTWRPEYPGERQMVKLPKQFRKLLLDREQPLDESIGEKLARWARGDSLDGGSAPARGHGGAAPQTRASASASNLSAGSGGVPAEPQRLGGAEAGDGKVPPAAAGDSGPCWKPVGNSRCKLVEGHAGRCIPEPPR